MCFHFTWMGFEISVAETCVINTGRHQSTEHRSENILIIDYLSFIKQHEPVRRRDLLLFSLSTEYLWVLYKIWHLKTSPWTHCDGHLFHYSDISSTKQLLITNNVKQCLLQLYKGHWKRVASGAQSIRTQQQSPVVTSLGTVLIKTIFCWGNSAN